jgi:hypothetical protein
MLSGKRFSSDELVAPGVGEVSGASKSSSEEVLAAGFGEVSGTSKSSSEEVLAAGFGEVSGTSKFSFDVEDVVGLPARLADGEAAGVGVGDCAAGV